MFANHKPIDPIIKDNRLNDIIYVNEVGPGGAYHDYFVNRNANDDGTSPIAHIGFQRGPRNDETSRRGVLDTDLLEIVRHRLQCFNAGEYACEENAKALEHVEEALRWLNRRVTDRANRGVLGTNEK